MPFIKWFCTSTTKTSFEALKMCRISSEFFSLNCRLDFTHFLSQLLFSSIAGNVAFKSNWWCSLSLGRWCVNLYAYDVRLVRWHVRNCIEPFCQQKSRSKIYFHWFLSLFIHFLFLHSFTWSFIHMRAHPSEVNDLFVISIEIVKCFLFISLCVRLSFDTLTSQFLRVRKKFETFFLTVFIQFFAFDNQNHWLVGNLFCRSICFW